MYLKLTTRVMPLLSTHISVLGALVNAVKDGRKLSYRKLLPQTDFATVSGVFKFIRKCKALGLKTNII